MKTRALCLTTLFLVACQATVETSASRSVQYLVAAGDFRGAVTMARDAWQAAPQDQGAVEDYRFATVAFLLERGRSHTFAGRDEEALVDFREAERLDPQAEQAAQWAEKTRIKLSESWFARARDHHTSDRLLLAAEAYEKALDYNYDNMEALEGLFRIGVQLGYRDELSDDYYNEGLGALRQEDLHVAGSRFDYSGKYRYGDERPTKRRAEVDVALAGSFAKGGLNLEEQGLYAAARVEFRIAIGLDADNQTAREGFERMRIEAEAHELYKRGEMWIRRGEYDQAHSTLLSGRELTSVQQDRFDELLGEIDDYRTAAEYEIGLNFEYDFMYVEAAETYRELLEERSFYEDVRARLTRLDGVIAQTQELYSGLDSLSGEDLQEALLQIDVLWPEYLDVQERLESLDGE